MDVMRPLSLAPLLADGDARAKQELCDAVAEALHVAGALVVRDPRCDAADSAHFLDAMERYFGRSREAKLVDARPDIHYQVGVTPDHVEVARGRVEADPKWRFMWRIGPRPTHTRYHELNAAPVVPDGMPEWPQVMDVWGNAMLKSVECVARAAAVGFGLEEDAFVERMRWGPHLLAPTGCDLEQHGQLDVVFAGKHCDLNFLTIHGKARFPGLRIWLRDGTPMDVQVPEGCLLVQAGKQMEWLTGGHVCAGAHEVRVTEETLRVMEEKKRRGESLWRVSSTVFGHVASDQVLRPLGKFNTPEALERYPPIHAGEFVQQELEAIRLKVA